MALTELEFNDKLAALKKYGVGVRDKDDKFFEANNAIIFKPYVRLGVYRFDKESAFHESNKVQCNIPKCNQVFESVFAYESHYNAAHRFKCSECSKSLPNAHFLDMHLSEKHDSFFAVQAERKPMYRCYLEECLHLSQNATERRDHCIKQHKFPHDFRFDIKARVSKKKTKSNEAIAAMDCNMDGSNSTNSVLSASNLIPPETMDEDVELENKSIILAAQNKPKIHAFSFGHKKSKTFQRTSDSNYAKALCAKSKEQKKNQTNPANLEDDRALDDLMESLPK